MTSIRRQRRLIYLIPCILAFIGLWLHRRTSVKKPSIALANITNPHTGLSWGYQPDLIPFWANLSEALVETKPNCSLPNDSVGAPLKEFASIKTGLVSVVKGSYKRPDLLKISQQDVDELRNTHARFVAKLPQLVPQLPFVKGTKGLVMTVSQDSIPELVVSLRMLRRTKTELPVEVFLESRSAYEKDTCERILPLLNATCLVLPQVLEAVPTRFQVSGNQTKAFALLFSSFDDVVLLDWQTVPVEKPDRLLDTEPFLSKGFVSWSDRWANTASSKYYEISSQPTPSPAERAASASSVFLISKTKKASTVLLSLYYNLYGPAHYYLLLTQNADVPFPEKETFLAAATALNASTFVAQTPPGILGYHYGEKKQKFKECATVQYNLTPDNTHQNASIDLKETSIQHAAFVHSTAYTMDAALIPDHFTTEINQRMWGPKEDTVHLFGGRDVEKQLWAETLYTGCHYDKSFRTWENRTATSVCKKIGRVYKFLFN